MSGHASRRVVVSAGAMTTTGASRADVEIDASASVRELRVLNRPRASTRLSGGNGVFKDHVSWRRNLPKQLTPGDVHRQIAVRRRVSARLRDAGEAC